MPRQKGTPKTGGRQKGTRNKFGFAAKQVFERRDFNSLEMAIDWIMDDSNDKKLRAYLLKEVMKYQFPQLKAIEFSGENGQINFQFYQQILGQFAQSIRQESHPMVSGQRGQLVSEGQPVGCLPIAQPNEAPIHRGSETVGEDDINSRLVPRETD